jgi:alanine dehydrogenase
LSRNYQKPFTEKEIIYDMRIGILKETATPADNRVALTPMQAGMLRRQYPELELVVQSSPSRTYSDETYQAEGVPVVEDLSACDLLLGIKAPAVETLIPGKHYVFFGHFAKGQTYNRPFLKKLMEQGITFSDYEYMVDEGGGRVCAFGWWAGVVGIYYTLQGYGIRTGQFILPKPAANETADSMKNRLRSIPLPAAKLVLTGRGRVAHGAQYMLQEIGATWMPADEYLRLDQVDRLVYTNAGQADFIRFARTSDILVCGHYWSPGSPVYLSADDYRDKDFRIRMIGDITCDIEGSIRSTLRGSTHAAPFYDYDPVTEREEPAFSSEKHVTVMAVDTCPNALSRETSQYFGEMLLEHVVRPLAEGRGSAVLERATILEQGRLTPRFDYLESFVNGGTGA